VNNGQHPAKVYYPLAARHRTALVKSWLSQIAPDAERDDRSRASTRYCRTEDSHLLRHRYKRRNLDGRKNGRRF
jgi:hypothetical protein